ncbi:MAG: hypothetical protein PHD95_00860 [Candidatus ainarchaeum sp.]|nr:hypothetical protein [Candidatus ainarchaeum sp.]
MRPKKRPIINTKRLVQLTIGKSYHEWLRRRLFSGRRYLGEFEKEAGNKKFTGKADFDKFALKLVNHKIGIGNMKTIPEAIKAIKTDIAVARERIGKMREQLIALEHRDYEAYHNAAEKALFSLRRYDNYFQLIWVCIDGIKKEIAKK